MPDRFSAAELAAPLVAAPASCCYPAEVQCAAGFLLLSDTEVDSGIIVRQNIRNMYSNVAQ